MLIFIVMQLMPPKILLYCRLAIVIGPLEASALNCAILSSSLACASLALASPTSCLKACCFAFQPAVWASLQRQLGAISSLVLMKWRELSETGVVALVSIPGLCGCKGIISPTIHVDLNVWRSSPLPGFLPPSDSLLHQGLPAASKQGAHA